MNRKTFTSIIAISAILIIGLGALTLFVYLPNRKSNQNQSEIKGARISSELESTIDYLTLQIGGLKDLERNLLRVQPYLTSDNSEDMSNQIARLIDSRIELLNLKAKSQGWTVPATAADVQSFYQKTLDQYILMYEKFIDAFNQQLGQRADAQFALLEAERAESTGSEMISSLKIKNGELLKQAGATFTDTDADTLPDVWEQIAGSDFTLVDTDEDGLTDAEEFNIYITKPGQPDTDADGYIDGIEVRGGYNPLGEGPIINK